MRIGSSLIHGRAGEGDCLTWPSLSQSIFANGEVALTPSHYHLMFQGLGRALVKGDTLEATLTFQHIGNLPVEFSIAGVGATEPSGGDASAGDAMKDMKMK